LLIGRRRVPRAVAQRLDQCFRQGQLAREAAQFSAVDSVEDAAHLVAEYGDVFHGVDEGVGVEVAGGSGESRSAIPCPVTRATPVPERSGGPDSFSLCGGVVG